MRRAKTMPESASAGADSDLKQPVSSPLDEITVDLRKEAKRHGTTRDELESAIKSVRTGRTPDGD